MDLDIAQVIAVLQIVFEDYYTFYSRYYKDWIAKRENGLNRNNSVIKRL